MLTPALKKIVKDSTFKTFGYIPHPAQQQIHDCNKRFIAVMCGRRFGKSLLAAQEVAAVLFNPAMKNQRIWVVAPTHDLANKVFREVWQIMLDHISPGSIIKKSDSIPKFIKTRWGSTFECKSADNPDSLIGEGLDLLIVDEAAKIKLKIWEKYLRPTLTDRKGRALFITTPEGTNWFYERYKRGQDTKNPKWSDWASFRFTSFDNPGLPVEDIEQARDDLSNEAFRQEYLADPHVMTGRVYKEFFVDTHVTSWTPESFDVVFGGIDYGFVNPSALVVLGVKDGRYYVLDEFYKKEQQLADIATAMTDFEKRYGVRYWFADHEAAYNKSLQDSNHSVIKAKKDVAPGIEAVAAKIMIRADELPRLIVNERCENLINELENYQYDAKDNRNTKEEPLKKDDHACDALRYAIFTYEKAGKTQFVRADIY